ncbi:Long-chain-fatty-acid--CoA ligase [wastewater metagenome]|uniref:Long-chain-fatty-acid--CoA ligase n=2 Tax=unclassified sequences TaxID=12908 RepID=A0A5B8RFQ9_9ZZZZ|nr:AMP-binding protein [Arhodomonas sp. KWT]QEA06678.1 long-chain-fatty-acid--CoA ligase [uncultured organism]
MKRLLFRIEEHARRSPGAVAVADGATQLDYAALQHEIEDAAERLPWDRVGLLAENSCGWAVVDLAVARRGGVCVPMPVFFSDGQLLHLIRDAGLDVVLTDAPERVSRLIESRPVDMFVVAGQRLAIFVPGHGGKRSALPAGTAKVTYTSGTTGAPRGVCLSGSSVERVAATLCDAVTAQPRDRSLALLPLSTLLENVGGLYAPLWAGGRAQVPSLEDCGITGSSGLDPRRMMLALAGYEPTTLILVPQLLKALTECVVAGIPAPRSLRFAAVGGAPSSAALIRRARTLGIPAFEGYGLSEAASVVTLNVPGADRPGSAGRALPHVRLAVDDNGEVVVHGELFLGYLGSRAVAGTGWPTGDLGRIDEDGYLHIVGRRKTAFATAFGRNVAPEWVESELVAGPGVAQAAVFGEGRPFNVAVIVPMPGAPAEALRDAVDRANEALPDYARVAAWVEADAPFVVANGLASAAGAPHRAAIGERYQPQIQRLYEQGERHAVL